MVRDDDDVTPELRRLRGEGVRSHTTSKQIIVTLKAVTTTPDSSELNYGSWVEKLEWSDSEHLWALRSNR